MRQRSAHFSAAALALGALAGAGCLSGPAERSGARPGALEITPETFGRFREAFNASGDGTRVLVLLSPT